MCNLIRERAYNFSWRDCVKMLVNDNVLIEFINVTALESAFLNHQCQNWRTLAIVCTRYIVDRRRCVARQADPVSLRFYIMT